MNSPAVPAYPTRTGEAQMTYRQEPVVWCDPTDPPAGPLSADDLSRYQDQGFLVFPGLLDETLVSTLNNELIHATRDDSRGDNPRYILGNSENDVRRIYDIHVNRPEFFDLARDQRLAGAARQVLDSDVYLHSTRAELMPGTFGEGYPWHSDFEGWHAEDGMPTMRAMGATVLLSPTDEHGAAMVVSPGSHHTFISCTVEHEGATPAGWDERYEPDLFCVEALLDSCGIQRIEGPPGTVVLFDSNLLHATVPNLSPDVAASLFFAYNSVENALGIPVVGGEQRDEWVAHREKVAPVEIS